MNIYAHNFIPQLDFFSEPNKGVLFPQCVDSTVTNLVSCRRAASCRCWRPRRLRTVEAGGEERQKSREVSREQDGEESGELRVRLHVALKRGADSPGDKASR